MAHDYHVGQEHEILLKSPLGRAILVGPNIIKVRRVTRLFKHIYNLFFIVPAVPPLVIYFSIL